MVRRMQRRFRSWLRDWRRFMLTRPSVWATLTAYIPVRVWGVSGPNGDGPYGLSIQEAIDFIAGEVEGTNELVDDDQERLTEPRFTADDLLHLWRPGARVTDGDWSIYCYTLPRYLVGLYEWEGY